MFKETKTHVSLGFSSINTHVLKHTNSPAVPEP